MVQISGLRYLLCRFGTLLFCQPLRQVDHVRSVDAEEDVQDFCFLLSCLVSTHIAAKPKYLLDLHFQEKVRCSQYY